MVSNIFISWAVYATTNMRNFKRVAIPSVGFKYELNTTDLFTYIT